ncbi:Replication protein P, partial [Haemophilus influenzae]
IGTP